MQRIQTSLNSVQKSFVGQKSVREETKKVYFFALSVHFLLKVAIIKGIYRKNIVHNVLREST